MTLARHGTYHYWKDGIRQPVREPWALQTTPQGAWLRGERWVADQLVLAVGARFRAGRCESFDVIFHRSPEAKPLTASYQVEGDCLRWRREDAESPGTSTEGQQPFGEQHHLFPLLRAATGMLIEQLSEGPGTVIVPWLREPPHAPQLLLPLESQRSAILLEGEDRGSRRYRYCGGEYGDEGVDCWLDATGLLQRYRWSTAGGLWEVRLAGDHPG